MGNDVHVGSAFHNVAAALLIGDNPIKGEVLVFGNNKDAREHIIGLIQKLGMIGWLAGSIDNSVVAESMTSVLIFMNKFYKMEGAGINIYDSNLNH